MDLKHLESVGLAFAGQPMLLYYPKEHLKEAVAEAEEPAKDVSPGSTPLASAAEEEILPGTEPAPEEDVAPGSKPPASDAEEEILPGTQPRASDPEEDVAPGSKPLASDAEEEILSGSKPLASDGEAPDLLSAPKARQEEVPVREPEREPPAGVEEGVLSLGLAFGSMPPAPVIVTKERAMTDSTQATEYGAEEMTRGPLGFQGKGKSKGEPKGKGKGKDSKGQGKGKSNSKGQGRWHDWEARQHSNDYGFGSGRYGRSGGYGA